MEIPHERPAISWWLRAVCAVMLIGHGWMCWNGQMPLRALLWDEKLVAAAVEKLAGMSWGEWVSSLEVDAGINRVIRVQGVILAALGIAILMPLRLLAIVCGYLAAVNLVFLAWLKYHDSGLGVGHFFEHASQFCMPLVVALCLGGLRWRLVAAVALALTFTCHGLSALGVESQVTWLNHPRPGSFLEMTMLCLGLESEAAAARVLDFAGVLDLVAAVLIFLRGWPRVAGLAYMLAWGALTALARPWSHFEPAAAAETLFRWLPELLLRAPHFGLALCLLVALRRDSAKVPKVT